MRTWISMLLVACAACATTTTTTTRNAPEAGVPVATNAEDRCVHGVACEVCVQCHPSLVARFKAAGDWCPEHALPESQCGLCHPEVVVAAPAPPDGADVQRLISGGEDVTSLEAHAVRGKVTIFDFYADWCGPCRKVDAHVFSILRTRSDVAYRKLNIVSWETPLAKHHLATVTGLPYVVVYGKDGKLAGTMSGLQLDQLDRSVAAGGAR